VVNPNPWPRKLALRPALSPEKALIFVIVLPISATMMSACFIRDAGLGIIFISVDMACGNYPPDMGGINTRVSPSATGASVLDLRPLIRDTC
jgi:hypothetical protein